MPAALSQVVIVGGGFGGLYAARTLARRLVRVTLLDRRYDHLFQPLLYQKASSGALNVSSGRRSPGSGNVQPTRPCRSTSTIHRCLRRR